MKAVVDRETCTGCGLCVEACPEVFKMEGEKAVAYVSPVEKADEQSCKEAAEQCPVEVITTEN